ncbi:MAG: DegT/DnrJ/EryC1/StrS family aminotransferase, partial [Candidatus Hydrogenedentales bacterium]
MPLQIGGSERRAAGRIIAHSAPTIGPQECAAAIRVLQSGRIAQGAEVEAFEHECAAYAGRRYAVAVNSGTAALHLALMAFSHSSPTSHSERSEESQPSLNAIAQSQILRSAQNDFVVRGTGFQPVRPAIGRPSPERTGWKPAPRILVPSYACASLITACHLACATPVLADVDENFINDPE